MSTWAGRVLGWLPHTLGPMSVFPEPIREACPGECSGPPQGHSGNPQGLWGGAILSTGHLTVRLNDRLE